LSPLRVLSASKPSDAKQDCESNLRTRRSWAGDKRASLSGASDIAGTLDTFAGVMSKAALRIPLQEERTRLSFDGRHPTAGNADTIEPSDARPIGRVLRWKGNPHARSRRPDPRRAPRRRRMLCRGTRGCRSRGPLSVRAASTRILGERVATSRRTARGRGRENIGLPTKTPHAARVAGAAE
jgi:hypothetical protein